MKLNFWKLLPGLLLLINLVSSCDSKPEKAALTIYCTSDVHGTVFDYDFKRNKESRSSLANVSAYIKEERAKDSTALILLDNGDFLQGQPTNYYYNFVDTSGVNLTAQVMNYLRYDAASVGNHDIEAGHPVYDKVVNEFNFPWLSANTIREATGKPYFKPYTVLYRKGIKIVVLGMTTPGIYKWLPKKLWEGMDFQDMVEAAQYWVPKIQKEEQPDLLIGLFHSGFDYNYAGENAQMPRNENAGVLVAQQVDGFDLIILGHDHQEKQMEVINNAGHKVVILDPKSHSTYLGKINVELNRNGKQYDKIITTELIPLSSVPKDTAYLSHFTPEMDKVKTYIGEEIGEFTESLSGRDGIFGPSAFTDFIHNAQLAATGADISFSTVLQMDALIGKGKVTIRDMFNLYSYENGLYIMAFTGKEIDQYLEYAYGLQYNTMTSAKDHLLRFKKDSTGELIKNSRGKYVLVTDFFNYSCAAGINYTVDLTKPEGERVEIHSMSDGSPFDENRTYQVAINSYRGNGGGGHLSKGLGWSKKEMDARITKIMPKDVRFYIMEYIREKEVLSPQCRKDWKVVPARWFKKGKEQDYDLLYN